MAENLPSKASYSPDEAEAAPRRKLWNMQVTCEYLGISRSKFYALIARGDGPPAYRVGGVRRYDPTEVEQWVRSQAIARSSV